ncbi:ABC transporter permease [Brooklawnia sp.]|uniref:ABC transporter permease n=1 Tax=Brooklawnia sp. TaxID=2699740 RepID=UPI00311DA1D3
MKLPSSESIRMLLVRNGVLLALVALIAVFGILNPRFLSAQNLQTILLQISELGLIALPVAFVVMQGTVDMSVGSIATLAAVIGSQVMVATQNPLFGVAAGLAVGVIAGLLNGVLVAKAGLNPFVVTLGFLSAWGGLALFLSDGRTISGLPKSFTNLGSASIMGIRMQIVLLVIAIIASWFTLNRTARGREILAVGGNTRAAHLMGLPVSRIKVTTYVVSGLVAAFVGLLLSAKLGATSPVVGQGLEVDALTVVLLGGIAFEGGSGRISGVVYGLAFVGALKNGLVILSVSPYLQTVIVGLTLVAAVMLDRSIQQAVARAINLNGRKSSSASTQN